MTITIHKTQSEKIPSIFVRHNVMKKMLSSKKVVEYKLTKSQ